MRFPLRLSHPRLDLSPLRSVLPTATGQFSGGHCHSLWGKPHRPHHPGATRPLELPGGLEPPSAEYESAVLPLNYGSIWGWKVLLHLARAGVEPVRSGTRTHFHTFAGPSGTDTRFALTRTGGTSAGAMRGIGLFTPPRRLQPTKYLLCTVSRRAHIGRQFLRPAIPGCDPARGDGLEPPYMDYSPMAFIPHTMPLMLPVSSRLPPIQE